MGKLTEDARTLVLNTQQRQQSLGEHRLRVGEIAVQLGVLTNIARDEVLEQQTFLKKQGGTPSRRLIPHPRSTSGWELLIAFIAVAIVVVVTWTHPHHLHITIVVVSFIAYFLVTLLQYWGGRSLALSLQRAALPTIAFVVFSLVLFAAISIFGLEHDPSHLHRDVSTPEQVHMPDAELARIRRITLAFSSMAVAVLILTFYAFWKFHALRYAESRLGAMKDIIIRVESILRDQSKSQDERQNAAIKIVLRGLRNVIRLSIGDRMMLLVSFIRPSFNQVRVIYYVKDENFFKEQDAAYPEKVSDEVADAFAWVRQNHRPALLNEQEFNKLTQMAKRITSSDWRQGLLNMTDRHEYISVCGWIHDKQEILISPDASKCLALDNSFLKKLEEEGFDASALQWLEVGSFVGCRVVGKNGATEGVLLAIKNMRKGFPPEDIEVVITAGQILSRISQAA